MKLILSVLALASMITVATANDKGLNVVYGEDNRIDVFASPNPALVKLAASTAAMIAPGHLNNQPNGDVLIKGQTLAGRGICENERFSKQITAANCSGFLVSSNVLVTAGHCITNENDCSSYRWVFDYKVSAEDQGAVTVPQTSVYSCKRIISRDLNSFTKDDYAVIELDRKVTDRAPLTFRKRGKVATTASLAVIGHPSGLPAKIADNASVRAREGKYFVANLDTYGGNSGSAVFNTKSLVVEGILVRGENDYTTDEANNCLKSVVCEDDSCRGEDVTYITNISALRKLGK